MKLLILVALLFSSASLMAEASGVNLFVGATQPEQFRYEVKDQGLSLSIFRGDSHKEQSVRLRHTLSDSSKLHIQLKRGNDRVITVEFLLTVLSVGNAEQDIQIYAPVKPAEVVLSQKIDPMCTIKNFGDFYWDSSAELRQKLRLRESGGEAVLEISVQKELGQKAEFKPSGCSFRLLRN